MAKRRRTYRRYTAPIRRRTSRYYKGIRRRVGKPKIPLEVAIAGISIPFMPPSAGWSESPASLAMRGDLQNTGTHLAKGFLNLEPNGTINLWQTLNPTDFNGARYFKILILAGLMAKIRHRLARNVNFGKLPLVGKIIS